MLSAERSKKSGWFHVDPADYLSRGDGHLGLRGKLDAYLISQQMISAVYPYAYLVTAPRFCGYSFNPVSFWYLYSERKELTAMILEVNNTFDERRVYILERPEPADEITDMDKNAMQPQTSQGPSSQVTRNDQFSREEVTRIMHQMMDDARATGEMAKLQHRVQNMPMEQQQQQQKLEGIDPIEHHFQTRAYKVLETEHQKRLQPKIFRSVWKKDFHVSPFNSREGSYNLAARDILPFDIATLSKVSNTITLSSSGGHRKLIASVFSDGGAIDPTTMTSLEKVSLVLKWGWVGFVTFPRIIREAWKLYFKKRLAVFFRPEVAAGTIARHATETEKYVPQELTCECDIDHVLESWKYFFLHISNMFSTAVMT